MQENGVLYVVLTGASLVFQKWYPLIICKLLTLRSVYVCVGERKREGERAREQQHKNKGQTYNLKCR